MNEILHTLKKREESETHTQKTVENRRKIDFVVVVHVAYKLLDKDHIDNLFTS